MHVVLGLLTSIITILYLLDRMDVNLGGLNPFESLFVPNETSQGTWS